MVEKYCVLWYDTGTVSAIDCLYVIETDNKIKYNPDMTEINSIPILSAIPDFSGQKIIIDDVDASESEAENGKEN